MGQTGVPASLTLSNQSTGAQGTQHFTVGAITLVASCGTQAISGGDCPPAAVDPGVLRVSVGGFGEAGTACGGGAFAIAVVEPIEGKYLFSPSTPVVLGSPGTPDGVCIIDFTVDVVSAPTRDADAAALGAQTAATVFAVGVGADGLSAGAFATNEATITGGTGQVAAPLAAPLGAVDAGPDPRAVAQFAGHAAAVQMPVVGASQLRAAARCVVPNVRDDTWAKAGDALRRAHCAVAKPRRRAARHTRSGRVVGQHPRAGSVFAAGTRVTVTLAGSG